MLKVHNKRHGKFWNGAKSPRILITAGPTVEPIDPVRFVSNRSTGFMGYEIARAARRRNYKVTLISGPVALRPPAGVKVIRIEKATELLEKTRKELRKADILIMASAVSDFRPAFVFGHKIKSGKISLIRLVRNPDILKSISKKERKGKIVVGFSLESDNLITNSLKKLKDKNLDLIVANKYARRHTPFGAGLKTLYILDRKGIRKRLVNMPKSRIARAILDTIEELCYTPS